MKEIVLSEHKDMQETRICHECHGVMAPCTDNYTCRIQDEEVCVIGVKAWKCVKCGEVVYSSQEAKLIEEALKPYMQQKGEEN